MSDFVDNRPVDRCNAKSPRRPQCCGLRVNARDGPQRRHYTTVDTAGRRKPRACDLMDTGFRRYDKRGYDGLGGSALLTLPRFARVPPLAHEDAHSAGAPTRGPRAEWAWWRGHAPNHSPP